MYLLSMTTYPNEQQQEDNYSLFEEEQNWYFSALIKNGQILSNDCNTIKIEDKFVTYLLAPEKDSLDLKNANVYVEKFYNKLVTLCRQSPSVELLGESVDYQLSCNCATSDDYMLYSDYATNESPVVCGNCGQAVPLYKLPKIFGEDEYYTVLNWQEAYTACDRLFMQGIGERFAYKQLSKATSDLSKQALEICKEFEIATNKPFYYFLFRYYSPHKSSCPLCSEPWELVNETLKTDYCCKQCRLIAEKVK